MISATPSSTLMPTCKSSSLLAAREILIESSKVISSNDAGEKTSRSNSKLSEYHRQLFKAHYEDFRDDKDVVLALIVQDATLIRRDNIDGGVGGAVISNRLKDDKDVVLAMFRSHSKEGWRLKYVSERLRDDREVVMAAITAGPEFRWTGECAFEYASERLRDDEEIVMTAIRTTLSSKSSLVAGQQILKYASKRLRDDKQFVLAALLSGPTNPNEGSIAADYSSSTNNTAAVNGNNVSGEFIKCVSQRLRDDKEVLLAAISTFPAALEYASESLKSDKEVVLAAVMLDPRVIKYASDQMKDDPDVLLVVFSENNNNNMKNITSDRSFWIYLLKDHASERLKNDKTIITAAIQRNGCALQYASEALQDDVEIALQAVTQNPFALEYVSERIKQGVTYQNWQVTMTALKRNPSVIRYASKRFQNDKTIVMKAVLSRNVSLFSSLSKQLQNDKDVALAVVAKDGCYIQYVSEQLKDDKDIVMTAITGEHHHGSVKFCHRQSYKNNSRDQQGVVIEYASQRLQKDTDVILAAVKTFPGILQKQMTLQQKYKGEDQKEEEQKQQQQQQQQSRGEPSVFLQQDKYFMLEAVTKNGLALRYASDDLKQDKDIVLAAVNNNGRALKYACISALEQRPKGGQEEEAEAEENQLEQSQTCIGSLNDDRDIVSAAVAKNGLALEFASKKLQNDRHIVLTAVLRNGTALAFASERLRNDKEIVLAAISKNVTAFEVASEILRDDQDVVHAAYKIYRGAILYASTRIQNVMMNDNCSDTGREAAMMIVQNDGLNLRRGSLAVRSDKTLVLAAIKQNWKALEYASNDLKSDKDVVFTAIRKSKGCALEYALESIRDESDIVMAAVKRKGMTLQYASMRLRDDMFTVITAVKSQPMALQFASAELRDEKEGIVLNAVAKQGKTLQHASMRLRDDNEVVWAAFIQNCHALQFASERLKDDKQFMLAAIRRKYYLSSQEEEKGGLAIEYASDRLKDDEEIVWAAVVEKNAWSRLEHASCRIRGDKQIFMKFLEQEGNSLKWASHMLRCDKECVLAAVSNRPEALKFALGGLNQDRDCLITAGLWDESYDEQKRHGVMLQKRLEKTQVRRKIVLSTRFSLSEDSTPTATQFTVLLKEHPVIASDFAVYSPNAFDKDTCDPEWTRLDWACRGTFETCGKNSSLKSGEPKSNSCWRYSFRWQLQEAKQTDGFMIQIVEYRPAFEKEEEGNYSGDVVDDKNIKSKFEHRPGNGQQIETFMARDVGVKVFRIYQPGHIESNGSCWSTKEFEKTDIENLVKVIEAWYSSNRSNVDEHEVWCAAKMRGESRVGKYYDQGLSDWLRR